MVELLSRVDPNKYQTFMLEEKGKKVLYAKLQKALYGTLQAALLFWEHQTKFLTEELGFTVNPYDRCIINKVIKGKQCTIIWYVGHLKLSHVRQTVLKDIAKKLNSKYGQKVPLNIHQGPVQEYLGMTINYSEEGKVKFQMRDYMAASQECVGTKRSYADVV
jgi:hypothetical protein